MVLATATDASIPSVAFATRAFSPATSLAPRSSTPKTSARVEAKEAATKSGSESRTFLITPPSAALSARLLALAVIRFPLSGQGLR